jgi:precorrin-2 dehydrogenase/sirohydrochlorin ferrochelatase
MALAGRAKRPPDCTMPEPATPPPEPYRDFPVVLDVTGWHCLMVGGGPVAARRVAALLSAGARVTVVAPDLAGALEDLAAEAGADLAVQRRPYRSGEAAGYQLVGTATGRPDVDAEVVADAARAGVLVTGADRSTPGTMRLPAVHRSGPVTLAVSTAGTSPALARWLCDRLAACLPAALPALAALVDESRAAQQRAGRATGSVEWASLLDDVVPLVEAGRMDEAREVLRSVRPGPTPPAPEE